MVVLFGATLLTSPRNYFQQMLRIEQTIKHNPAERALRRRLLLIKFNNVKCRFSQDIKILLSVLICYATEVLLKMNI